MAGSVSQFLGQGTSAIPAPTGSDTATAGPLWLQDYIASTLGGAAALAQTPYTPFPGPLVAQPSDQTKQAWNLAGNNVGSYSPYLQQAGALTQQLGAPITSGDINTFLNPYQNYITGALNTNLQQNILPGIQDKFVGAGQSRSPQEAQVTGQAIYGTQQAAGQALAGGYQGALNSLLAQRQQQGQAGAQMGTMGALSSQLGATDVGQLAAAGSQQDALSQANLNAAYQQFQQQQQYPYQQLGFLSDVVRGLPVASAGTNTQVAGTSYQNAPSQYASGIMGAGNLVQALGYRRGGAVRPRMGALSIMRRAA